MHCVHPFVAFMTLSFSAPAIDIALAKVLNHPFVLTPASVQLTVSGGNASPGTISEFILNYSDGQNTFTDTITYNLPEGATFTVSHSTPINLAPGDVRQLTIWVEASGDPNQSNDTLSFTLYGLLFRPDKVVVLEEGQGTWCEWCPRGYVSLDSMMAKYGDTLAVVGVHTSVSPKDPMAIQAYSNWIWSGRVSGIPGATIDRTVDRVNTSNYDTTIAMQKELHPPASVDVSSTINHATTEIIMEVEVQMAATLVGDYRVNVIVIENQVTGTTPDYDQENIYSGGAHGPMGNYSSLPNPVPASQMVYQYVARALGGGIEGDSGSLPFNLPASSTHNYQYIVSLDSVDNPNNVEVIAIFLDGSTGRILNAGKGSLSTGVTKSLHSTSRLFPNPTTDISYLDLVLDGGGEVSVSIFDITGKLVDRRAYGRLYGQQLLPVLTQHWDSGLYFVKVDLDGSVETFPLMVN